jgi:uncharacterized Zn finger protein
MAKVAKEAQTAKGPQGIIGLGKDEPAARVVAGMLASKIVDIKPQLDFTTELGFVYPVVQQTAGVTGKEAVAVLESLTERGILRRSFSDRLLQCPRCHSINLRPSIHCPKCGSGDIVRGRIFEHLACGFVGVEEEFASKGKYICPKCKLELRTLGVDYQSRGVLRKCRDCGEIFTAPLLKWRCLKCSGLISEDEVQEVNIYAYTLEESKKNWLEFELQPKARFVEFLKRHGYKVTENARVKGRSGAEHEIDMLATRDDGVVTHNVAIGLEIARERIGLDRIMDFDVKAFDTGVHDKVLIVIPALGEEAAKFASYQGIRVLEPKDLETVLTGGAEQRPEIVKQPFEFKSKSQLIEYLKKQGYRVRENAELKGRSGAVHNVDILGIKDEGIITHRIAIGTQVDDKPMGLDRVFDFDDKAYDAGIMDKVLIAVPGLTREAQQFAERQGIVVFEVEQLEPAA